MAISDEEPPNPSEDRLGILIDTIRTTHNTYFDIQ